MNKEESRWPFRVLNIVALSILATLMGLDGVKSYWKNLLIFTYIGVPLYLLADLIAWGIAKLLDRKKGE